VGTCIILVMQITWTKYTYVCDPDECDSLVEYTCGDTFGFPSGDVRNFTCPCGRNMNLVSVEDATIRPTNERKEMETTTEVPTTYNANVLVTYKDIIDGVATYPTIKVNDLEYRLDRIKRLEEQLSASNSQLGKIIDNLTLEGWYNPNTDKDEVLRDLCEILGHTPQAEMSWTATLTVSGTTLVNLDEVEDFDIRYHIGDNLSVDSNDFQTNVDSWDVDYVDSQEWQ
jgi:hypothetical protein